MMGAVNPCDEIVLTANDGARIALRAHGAHVTGWAPAGGTERLWLSRDSECGPGLAIRGGIPVIWPQFNTRGPLPKHGFARDRAWVLESAQVEADGAAVATLTLVDDEATRAVLPQAFGLLLRVRAIGRELTITLDVRNNGTEVIEFTAALHSYFVVTNLAAAAVDGVAGADAEDSTKAGAAVTIPDGPLGVVGPVDLAIEDPTGPIRLTDPGLPELTITADGFDDVVVWNPGAGLAPGDVHAGGESEFVCVEPAVLLPVDLAPGAVWSGSARFEVAAG